MSLTQQHSQTVARGYYQIQAAVDAHKVATEFQASSFGVMAMPVVSTSVSVRLEGTDSAYDPEDDAVSVLPCERRVRRRTEWYVYINCFLSVIVYNSLNVMNYNYEC